MSTIKGDITFLFDEGVAFGESYDFTCAEASEAMRRLKKVVQARALLLATNVRVVRVAVKGIKADRIRVRGPANTWGHPRYALSLRNDGQRYFRRLRGCPDVLYKFDQLSLQGINGFREFNRVLAECGCQATSSIGGTEPIVKLEPYRRILLLAKNTKALSKKRLMALLGIEEGTEAFQSSKAKR